MLDPPSQSLLDRLFENHLCTSRDLRRCRKRVQQLTRDLPAFDSVWIDALLQERKLTPFQARLLDSDSPQRLVVGPCVLLDRLGGGDRGETFLARHKPTGQVCVLKRIAPRPAFSADEFAGFEAVVRRLADFDHPCMVGPQVCDRLRDDIVIVSRQVAGPHLAELLVRRGRFPAEIVWEIGRQLLDGLAALHDREQVHGDLRTHNVRLIESGVAVAVDAGIRPVVERDLTIHTAAAPERFDGIAPELIGTGRSHAPTTDFYALGCLLWQLLAGRPPFPGGDPLAKIAAHQTQTVGDVREWAPDTPPALAEAIAQLTNPDPTKRPQTAADALAVWGRPSRLARSKVSRFVAGFNTPARASLDGHGGSSARRWAPLFVLVFLLSGLATFLSDHGARSVVLNIVNDYAPGLQEMVDVGETPPAEEAVSPPIESVADDSIRDLPAAQDGVVELSSPGRYRAGAISTVGPLTIRGIAGGTVEIIVDDQPLVVSAEMVRLENLVLRTAEKPAGRRPASALVLVQADQLAVAGCTFVTHDLASSSKAVTSAQRQSLQPIGIGWRNLGNAPGGGVQLRDTVFAGHGAALHMASAPRRLAAENCLRLGPGALFVLAAAPRAGRPLSVQLKGVTCRDAGPLWNWRLKGQQGQLGRVRIEAANCLFDAAGPETALFEFLGDSVREDWHQLVSLEGADSIISPQTALAAWLDRKTGRFMLLPDVKMQVEGIFAVPFTYQGAITGGPAASELGELQGSVSLRSIELPGFHVR